MRAYVHLCMSECVSACVYVCLCVCVVMILYVEHSMDVAVLSWSGC